MYQGKTVEELLHELQRREIVKEDFVIDSRDLEMTPDTTLLLEGITNDEGMPANDLAHQQIATHTKIPTRYYDRLRSANPELLADNVNFWFNKEPKRRMVRTLDGEARAFLSDHYKRIDNLPVAMTSLQAMMDKELGSYEVVSSDVTDRNLYINVRMPKIIGDVAVGDPVQWGLRIRNSEVGLGALDISPLIYRLVCSNGMIVPKEINSGRVRKTHLGPKVGNDDNVVYRADTQEALDKAMLLQIRDAIHNLSDPNLFFRLMEEMRAATQGTKVENPIKAVEVLQKAYALPSMESEGILEDLIKAQDYSRWGVLNAVTAQANKTGADRAEDLHQLGGKILTLGNSEWQRIAEAA